MNDNHTLHFIYILDTSLNIPLCGDGGWGGGGQLWWQADPEGRGEPVLSTDQVEHILTSFSSAFLPSKFGFKDFQETS